MGSKKIFFKKTMSKGDWVKLLLVVAIWAACYGWLWYQYSQPFDYDVIVEKAMKKQVEVIQTKDGQLVKNLAAGYEVTVPKGWFVKKDDPNNLSFSNKLGFAPLEMGEDGILYDIVVYKTDKSLQNFIEEQNKKLMPGTSVSARSLKINGLEAVRQDVDQSGVAVGEGGLIYTEFYTQNNGNIIEVINTTQSLKDDYEFEKFVYSIKSTK